MIFKRVGQNTQRLLGSTCREMYNVWKGKLHKGGVVKIYVDDLLTGSTDYTRFMSNWILHNWPEERAAYPGLLEEDDLSAMKEHIKWLMVLRLNHRRRHQLLDCVEFAVPMKDGPGGKLIPMEALDKGWRPSFKCAGKAWGSGLQFHKSS